MCLWWNFILMFGQKRSIPDKEPVCGAVRRHIFRFVRIQKHPVTVTALGLLPENPVELGAPSTVLALYVALGVFLIAGGFFMRGQKTEAARIFMRLRLRTLFWGSRHRVWGSRRRAWGVRQRVWSWRHWAYWDFSQRPSGRWARRFVWGSRFYGTIPRVDL